MPLFGRKKKPQSTPEPIVEPLPDLPTPPEPNAAGLRELRDHSDYLLGLVEPLPPFGMQLLEAWNQTLCEDLVSMAAVPPVDLATMDGYAVRSADLTDASRSTPVILAVIEDAQDDLPELCAVPVTARTPMPHDTDAVLPERLGVRDDVILTVHDVVAARENVTPAGSSMAVGTPLMNSGDRLDARHIGLLAGAGIDKVFVRPRPRVVVLSSGEDILEPGLDMGQSDQTWDANSYLIASAARAVGAQVWRVGIVGNDPEQLSETVTDQLIRADLVISTTGSQRDYERIKSVLETLGQTDITEVAMLPGKTQAFGLVGDDKVPMILLPGNPVSAYVTFQAFVRPVLRKMMGIEPPEFTPVRAIASNVMRSAAGQVQLMRGIVRKERGIRTVEAVHDPDPLRELADCNALIVLDENTEVVRAGESALVWLLDEE